MKYNKLNLYVILITVHYIVVYNHLNYQIHT